jgi:hypothetical protein
MYRRLCPWCAEDGLEVAVQPSRWHDDGVEHKCVVCGRRCTYKDDDDPSCYGFFPGDIYRAFALDFPAWEIDWSGKD